MKMYTPNLHMLLYILELPANAKNNALIQLMIDLHSQIIRSNRISGHQRNCNLRFHQLGPTGPSWS